MPPAKITSSHIVFAKTFLERGIDVEQVAQMLANADDAFKAWKEKCELDQAWEYLFDNGWKLLINQFAGGGRVRAISMCARYSRVDQCADGSTRAEAVIGLAEVVAESVAKTKGE